MSPLGVDSSWPIGAAVDWLMTVATQAATGVTVNGQPVLVSDGPVTVEHDGMFVIGLSEPVAGLGRPTTVSRTIATIGMPVGVAESIDIPCCIDVRVPKTKTAPNAQKAARDQAESLFRAFNGLLLGDPSFGGGIEGGAGFVTALEAVPSLVGTAAEQGRRFLISFTVHVTDLSTN